MSSLIHKGRKPRFHLHLSIYDLNNIPLVSGQVFVKWHVQHSIHTEHRGRTVKCPVDIVSHSVQFNWSRLIPVRISIDRNNSLTDCPVDFEIVQEFSTSSSGREEKVTLGMVRLNLSEYVEESESYYSHKRPATRDRSSLENARETILGPALNGHGHGHNHFNNNGYSNGYSNLHGGTARRRTRSNVSRNGSSMRSGSPTDSASTLPPSYGDHEGFGDEEISGEVEEGIVRRYLMQESKVNSTIKIGILMEQIDGERNYVAPPLKTAPIFGGIAGIMVGDTNSPGEASNVDDLTTSTKAVAMALATATKSRDSSELQDIYRSALAASWSSRPGELLADECVEDIFAGGNGWKNGGGHNNLEHSRSHHHHHHKNHPRGRPSRRSSRSRSRSRRNHSRDSSDPYFFHSDDEDPTAADLRSGPGDYRRSMGDHMRTHSGASDRTTSTITGAGPPRPSSYAFLDAARPPSFHTTNSESSPHINHVRSNSNGRIPHHRHAQSREDIFDASGFYDGAIGRRESLASMVPTLGSSGIGDEPDASLGGLGRGSGMREPPVYYRRPREVNECEVRDDMVSWTVQRAAA